MKLIVTKHAVERIEEKLTKAAPELRDIERLKKLIRRSGKWYVEHDEEADSEIYYCTISK